MLATVARKGPDGQYDNGFTREHLMPLKLGGYRRGNIVLTHLKCNSSRGHTPPTSEQLLHAMEIWQIAKRIRKGLPTNEATDQLTTTPTK